MTRARDGGLQRIGVLASLPTLLAELGVETASVYDGLGVAPQDLTPDTRLPFATCLAILDRASQQANRPDLALLLAQGAGYADLGMVGQLMECAPTLGRALADYVSVQGGLSGAASAYLILTGDVAALGFGIYDRHAPGAEHYYAIATTMAVNAVRQLSGGQATVDEVHFSHRAPEDPRPYERTLKARICFNQEQTAVLFSRAALDAVNPKANSRRRAELLEAVAEQMRLHTAATSARLRHLLRPALSLGDAQLSMFARRLGLSVRSLNRRLSAEGTTFTRERDAIRFAMACELLALTDLSMGDISMALNYANHSAFDRSFRRWCGTSPTEWRQDHLASLRQA